MKKRAMCLLLAMLMASTLLTGCAEAIQIEHNSVPMGEGPEDQVTAISAEAEQAAADEAAKLAAEAEEAARQAAEEAAAAEAAKKAAEEEAARLQAAEQAAAEEAARQQAEADAEAARQAAEQAQQAQQANGTGMESPGFEEPSAGDHVPSAPEAADEPAAVSASLPTDIPEADSVEYIELICSNGSISGWSVITMALQPGRLAPKGLYGYQPELPGYVFTGWYKQDPGLGTPVGKRVEEGDVIEANVTALYAGWEEAPTPEDEMWILLHVVNGSFGGTFAGEEPHTYHDQDLADLASIFVKLEDGRVLPESVDTIIPERSHGQFEGWYTQSPNETLKVVEDASGAQYEVWSTAGKNGEQIKSGEKVPEGVQVLYAVFADKADDTILDSDKRVTYYLDLNGIDGMWGHCMTSTRLYDGKAGGYTLTAGDLALRYVNWDGEHDVAFNSQADLDAYWSGKNANGGFNGYIFLGWATSPNAETPDVVAGETVLENEQSIYAVWTKGEESSQTFDRNDPAAGPLEFLRILGQLSSSMEGSTHAAPGASFALSLQRFPVRAQVNDITWTISVLKTGQDLRSTFTAKPEVLTLELRPNEERSVSTADGDITATAHGYDLVISDVRGGMYAVTVSADGKTNAADGEAVIHTNTDAKVSFYHQWVKGETTGEADCENGTQTHYSCSVDGCEVTKVEEGYPLGHVYDSRSAKGVHIYQDPTCTEAGKKHLVCLRCGKEDMAYEYSVPALGHDWQLDESKPAEIVDCRHTTYYDKCARCGEERAREENAYNTEGHKWGDWIIVRDADFLNEGQQRHKCSVCGTTEYGQIPVKPVIEVSYSGFFSVAAASQKQLVEANGATYCADASGYAVTGWQTVDGKKYYFGPADGKMRTGLQTISGKKYYLGTDGAMQTSGAKVNGKYYCFDANGVQTTGKGWKTVSGKKYYFNNDGTIKVGWQTISGKKYYLGTDGAMQTGWQTISGKKYYLGTDGVMKTGWQTISKKKYYFNSSGVMLTGWQTISKKKYYFDADGVMLTGLQTISGKKYYLGTDGVMKTGWQTISKKKYYFNSSGVMLTGWQTISKKKYYLGTDGVMLTGLQTISDKKYYLGTDGVMKTGWQTISKKKYYFNSSGVMLTGWQTISKKKYYLGTDGVMKTGWQTIDGKKYYLGSDGVMKTGLQTISGKKYYLGSDGVMKTGWQTVSKKKYYFGTDGIAKTGWQTIDGQKYYLGTDGVVKTGWQTISKKKYYFDGSGVMKTGWQTISGKKYYLGTDGVMKTGWQTIDGKKYYFNSSGVMLTGKQKISGKTYTFNSDGSLK